MVLVWRVISQEHVSKESYDYGKELFKESHHLAKFGGYGYCDTGDNGLSFARDIGRPRDERVM